MLNRSSSELEEFDLDSIFNRSSVKFDDLNLTLILEEIDAANDLLSPPPPKSPPPPPPKSSNILLDRAFLEAQLEIECAAVASRWNKHTEPLKARATHTDYRSQGKLEDVMGLASLGLPPAKPEKASILPVVVLDSDSDKAEDDQEKMETNHQNINPVQDTAMDAKRMRRRNSNVQAARRARKKKEEEETKLESEVSQLRVENSSLSKRLTDISDLYDKETRDNTALKTEVEMLRAKVNQGETTMKRIALSGKLVQPMPEMYSIGLPSFPAMPMQLDDPNQHYYQTSSNSEQSNLYSDLSIQNGTFEIPLADNCNNLQTVPNLQEIVTSTTSDGFWNIQCPATTVATANTMGGT